MSSDPETSLSRSCKGCKHNKVAFIIPAQESCYLPCYDCFRSKAYTDQYEKEVLEKDE